MTRTKTFPSPETGCILTKALKREGNATSPKRINHQWGKFWLKEKGFFLGSFVFVCFFGEVPLNGHPMPQFFFKNHYPCYNLAGGGGISRGPRKMFQFPNFLPPSSAAPTPVPGWKVQLWGGRRVQRGSSPCRQTQSGWKHE